MERFHQKKNQSLESGCSFTPHTRRRTHDGPKLTLSPAAPIRELREAKEDSIERKDGMYDVEQSSRRNKGSIIINADQRARVRVRWQCRVW